MLFDNVLIVCGKIEGILISLFDDMTLRKWYWAKDSVSQDTLGLFSAVKLPVNMFLKKCSVIFGSLYVLGLKSFGDGGQELLLSIAFTLFRKTKPPFITFRAENNVVELNAEQKNKEENNANMLHL